MAAVWARFNSLMLVLVFLALLAVIGMLATGVRGGPLDPLTSLAPTDSVKLPGTPISGPTTINDAGHYYLTRDVRVTGGVDRHHDQRQRGEPRPRRVHGRWQRRRR